MEADVSIVKLIKKELETIEKYSSMLRGNIYEIKKNKKSENPKKTSVFHLTYKGDNNVTKTIYVRKEEVKNVKKMLSNYKKAKEAFDRIVEININLLRYRE